MKNLSTSLIGLLMLIGLVVTAQAANSVKALSMKPAPAKAQIVKNCTDCHKSASFNPQPAIKVEPLQASIPAPLVYVVQSGDTMSLIAERLAILDRKAFFGQVKNPNLIKVGQKLAIPVRNLNLQEAVLPERNAEGYRPFSINHQPVGNVPFGTVVKAFPKSEQAALIEASQTEPKSIKLSGGQRFERMTFKDPKTGKVIVAKKQQLRGGEYEAEQYGTFEQNGQQLALVKIIKCANWATMIFVPPVVVAVEPPPVVAPPVVEPPPVVVAVPPVVEKVPDDFESQPVEPAPSMKEPETTCWDGNAWTGGHQGMGDHSSGMFFGANAMCRPIPYHLGAYDGKAGAYVKYSYWQGHTGGWQSDTKYVAAGLTETLSKPGHDLTLYQGLAYLKAEGEDGGYSSEQSDVGIDLNAELRLDLKKDKPWFPQAKIGVDAFIPVNKDPSAKSNGASVDVDAYNNAYATLYSTTDIYKKTVSSGYDLTYQANLGVGHRAGEDDTFVYGGPAAKIEWNGRELISAYALNPEIHSQGGDVIRLIGINVNLPTAHEWLKPNR